MKNFARILCLALVAVMMVCTLASCAPASDPDKALDALKGDGYTAAKDTSITPAAIKLLTGVNVDAVVSGSKTVKDAEDKDKVETVSIIYFTSSEDAKTAFEKLDGNKEYEKEDDSDWVFAQSGKMVYAGTKAAVKAAR